MVLFPGSTSLQNSTGFHSFFWDRGVLGAGFLQGLEGSGVGFSRTRHAEASYLSLKSGLRGM